MLKPENAKKLLEEKRNGAYFKHFKQVATNLPENLREVAFAIMGRNPQDHAYWDDVAREKCYEAMPILDRVGVAGRMLVFGVLFPGFARHVEGGWQLLGRSSYQIDYGRKAF